MRAVTLIVAAAAVLAGCATSYQAQGLSGGFDETQVAPAVWRVSFQGNGYTSPERAADMALLRSAELTLQQGYSHFVLLRSDDDRSKQSTITTPSRSTITGQATTFGNTTNVNANVRTTPSAVITAVHPASRNTIQMLKAPGADGAVHYDAALLVRTLRAKYQIAEK